MTAPIEFTPEEQQALSKIDDLAKALARVESDLANANRRILREKAKKDQLLVRKQRYETRIREALQLIDTARVGRT
jgi:hypothetical protein